jgi:FixJ family two-component response regulator
MSRSVETVFIIDDDESVRRAVGRLIRSAGWNAETFATAEEFLGHPGRAAPGCLVLDLHLPGLCGLGLQERLRAEGGRVPIVFISADPDAPARERALRAGAVAFLQKPFEEQELLGAVRRAVG